MTNRRDLPLFSDEGGEISDESYLWSDEPCASHCFTGALYASDEVNYLLLPHALEDSFP